ncbi:MAG: transglycosylase domain-containing protein [Bacteroidota bacterium]
MDKPPISPNQQPQDASNNPPEAPKAPKKKPSYKIPRYFFLTLVVLIFLGIVGFVVYVGQTLPSFQEIENPQSDLSTQLLASDGSVLQTFFSRENRTNVRLDEISHYVIDALISTEDARFYQHSGVDPKSFLAILADLIKGREIRGGSTITMQLARNLYRNQVGKEQTYIRKIKEYLVSTFLERQFTKEEIITAYLNTVNIYGNSYGIETTSRRLFNKAAKDLTIEEAAVIVAMLKGQGVYNPYRYPERVVGRRNLVMNQMVKYGVVDSQRTNIDSLQALPLKLAGRTQDHVKGLAPYFREYVRNKLKTWCDERGYNLYTDGLQVYTTLDPRMQFHAEEAVKEHLSDLQKTFNKQIKGYEPYKRDPSFLVDLMKQTERYRLAKNAGKPMGEIEKEFNTPTPMTIFSWNGYVDTTMTPMDSIRYSARFLETGMVSIDPTNGHVKAWIGGIDYRFFKYDHVEKGKRQVGSTFKPFVYAAAIDNGKSPCDKILNQPVVFKNPGGKPWSPKNSDGSYGGLMTLRNGLATSTNLITAQLMNKVVNPSVVASYAYKLGIKSKLDEVPALCLGTTDLSVLELTNAYGTFANQGTWIEPVVITRIEDRHGNVLEEFIPETHVALSEEKAYLMVDLLKGVVDQPGGTGQRLRWKYGFTNEIGGKTGTTQNHSDGWFVGIRPNLATGVWVGCSDRRMRFRSIKYGQGANMALPIWALYMKRISEDPEIGIPIEDVFEKPAGIDHLLRCEPELDENDNKGKSSDELEELEGF